MPAAVALFLRADRTDFQAAVDAGLTPAACAFLREVYRYVTEAAESVQFRGQPFLAQLDAVAANRDLGVVALIVPIMRILTTEKMIVNFTDPNFKVLMSGSAVKTCRAAVAASPEIFNFQIASLVMLAEIPEHCFPMTQQPGFVDMLAVKMADDDVRACDNTWALLWKFMQLPDVQKVVCAKQSFRDRVALLLNGEHRVGLLRLLRLGTKVWSEGTLATRQGFGEVLKRSTGTIVAQYLARAVFYPGDYLVQTSLHGFVEAIKKCSRGDNADDFAVDFKKHLV
jgi:hypothetical protein